MVDILFVSQPRIGEISVPREIDCANPQQDFDIQPLGLASLAGASREYCSVNLIDLSVLTKDYNFLEEIIKKEKPKMIVGGFTTPSIKIDMALGKISKKNNALFGIWGPIPSALRNFLFENFELDFILENEPEITMGEISKNLKKKKKDIFYGVKGISYKIRGKVVFNGYRKLEKNLDSLPIPAYDLLPMNKYKIPYTRRLPMTIMRTSRGCIARCIFCLVGGQDNLLRGYGAPWRAYTPKRALEEIELIVKKYGVKEINFFDAEFTIDKNRVIEICKGIIKKKLNVIWNCNARADLVDENCLKWMKRAGCYSISYGVESVDKKIINICKKDINPKQVEKAVIITKKVGIQPALYFMMGLPGENVNSIKKTIKFAKKMALKYDLRPQCTIATPYPGTIFYSMARENKWIRGEIEDLEQTTSSIEYPELSKKELEYWHYQFYKQVVLNPIRLIKRVLRIKHFNEIKSIPIHLKDFTYSAFNKMRYIR